MASFIASAGLGWDAAPLLALLPVAALPILLAWRGRRRGRTLPPWAVVLEGLTLALAVAALAGPRLAMGKRASLPYLLFVDVSDSVRGQQQTVEKALAALPPAAPVERFDFARGIARHVCSTGVSPVAAGGTGETPVLRKPPGDATDVRPVLRMIPSRGHAGSVILTDGRFTDAAPGGGPATGTEGLSALAGAVARLVGTGFKPVPRVIVPLNRPVADARVEALSARRQGTGQVEIAVTVAANAPLERALTISRAGRDAALLVRPLALLPESPAMIRVADAVAPSESARYTAALSGGDAVTENDSAAVLVLPSAPRVAAVGLAGPTRRLLSGLEADARVSVVELSPGELADSPAGPAAFSAVVVSDPNGQSLSAAQRKALAEYVAAGGGLVMLGCGPHDSPADRDDPLNRVLPLVPNPFERRPLRLTVLLDRSGSMSQPVQAGAEAPFGSEPQGRRPREQKFEVAAEAVVALKDHLTPRDTLTVLTFADAPSVIYDSGDGPPDFAALRAALRRAQAEVAGSTNVTPAMDAALALGGSRAAGGRTPMLLVVSDLETEEFDPAAWADRLRQAKTDLAVVAIGTRETAAPGRMPCLESLAALAKAPYVRQDDVFGLARVFAAMVRQGRGPVRRDQPVGLVVTGPLFDSGLSGLPGAQAYLLTAAQKDALTLARTDGAEPVIARMQHGLGKSVSIALPLQAGQNLPWQASDEALRLVTSATRWTMRPADDGRFDVRAERLPGRVRVIVEARQGAKPMNLLGLVARLSDPSGLSQFELLQTAPGRYEGDAAAEGDQPVAVAVSLAGDPARAPRLETPAGSVVWHGSADLLYSPEYRSLGADRDALDRLAELTGGQVLALEALAPALRESADRGLQPLWPALLAGAVILMLTEWVLARVTRR